MNNTDGRLSPIERIAQQEKNLKKIAMPIVHQQVLSENVELLAEEGMVMQQAMETSQVAVREFEPTLIVQQAIETSQAAMKALEPTMAMQQAIETSQTVIKVLEPTLVNTSYMQNIYSPMTEMLNDLAKTQVTFLTTSAVNILSESAMVIQDTIRPLVMDWFQNVISSPVVSFLEQFHSLIPPEFNSHRFNDFYLKEMYDARWFPYVGWNADLALATEIFQIMGHTRKSKNRVKKIDQVVFSYFTKTEIEEMKKSWRQLELPEYKMRILHQCVQAYHRKEYALTVTVLATLWEGIIYDKTHDTRRKQGKRTKENLGKLISENNSKDIFKSYFDEFIMYECNSCDEAKEDVPGRNSIAHSMYNKYPSRKAALNAILFTDFLLRLEPLDKMNMDDVG